MISCRFSRTLKKKLAFPLLVALAGSSDSTSVRRRRSCSRSAGIKGTTDSSARNSAADSGSYRPIVSISRKASRTLPRATSV
jgi:hypothetical protein